MFSLFLACGQTPAIEPVPAPVPAPVEGRGPQRRGGGRSRSQEGVQEVHVGERSAWVHVPEDLPEGKVPLVLMFHGGHSSGLQVVGAWRELFDDPLILAFPNGQQDTEFSGWSLSEGDVMEHVRFVEALIDQLSASHPVDPSRIYAAGFSDGGQMTMRLACTTDRFAGFAVSSMTLKADTMEACVSKSRAPMLFMMGTADPRMTPEGRSTGPQGVARLGTEESLRFWLDRNRCEPEPAQRQELPERKVRDYACGRSPVRYVEVVGGGHAWPADGAREAWEFWTTSRETK